MEFPVVSSEANTNKQQQKGCPYLLDKLWETSSLLHCVLGSSVSCLNTSVLLMSGGLWFLLKGKVSFYEWVSWQVIGSVTLCSLDVASYLKNRHHQTRVMNKSYDCLCSSLIYFYNLPYALYFTGISYSKLEQGPHHCSVLQHQGTQWHPALFIPLLLGHYLGTLYPEVLLNSRSLQSTVAGNVQHSVL